MSSVLQENVDIEALLRSVAERTGGKLHRGGVTPPEETEPGSSSENDDQAQFHEYIRAISDEVVVPPDVDLLNTWSLVENCEPCETTVADRIPLQEPTISLGKDGLPVTHTCKYCKHVVINSSDLKRVQRVLVVRSREELDRAVEEGCVLFEWLRWHLYGCLFGPPSDSSEIFFKYEPERGSEECLGAVRGEFIDWGANQKGVKGKGEFGPFYFVTPKDNPAAKYVPFRPVNLAVSSDESFAAARNWIEECHSSHSNCVGFDEGVLPSRVLYVVDDSVKLIRTSELSDDKRYIALSYCWGGEQEQKTTTKSLQQREQDGLKLAELPQSLQDAVTATKQLGLSYMWIDSLCIVQDDDTDKEKEVARMADIYSGAYLTISAASSRSAHEGFLQDRSPSTIRRHVVPLQFLCPDGEKGWVYLYRPENYDPKKEEQLNTRGWALQEYLLSPRLLIYGSWQLRWACRTMQASDGGPDHVYPRSFERLNSKLQSNRTREDIRKELQSALDEERFVKGYHCMKEMDDIIDFWPTIVEEFTRRNLSVPSDRPAAMYGIARRYARLCDDLYAAGLWATNIARQLLWKRPSTYNGPSQNPGTRPPTWSWISVDGEVAWQPGLARKKPQLEVLSCYTAGFGPLGAANDIPLKVRGRIRDAFYLKIAPNLLFSPTGHDLSKELFHRSYREADDPDAGVKSTDLALTATASFDYPDEHSGPNGVGVVYLLEVLPYTDDKDETGSDNRPAGIILDLDPDNKFRRVGYFDFEWVNSVWLSLYNSGSKDHDDRRDRFRKEAFASCPMESVTII